MGTGKRALLIVVSLLLLTLQTGCARDPEPATEPAAPSPAPPPAAETPPPAASSAAKPAPPAPAPPQPAAAESAVAQPEPPPRPTPELPGALLAVVENSPGAWPQAGLEHADRIYEVEAEGGITRFVAVYYHQRAEQIGPVRSARMYFAHIARAYDAPFAHAGANADALSHIHHLRQAGAFKDLDEIYGQGGYFRRSDDRRPPHNLYTSTSLMLAGAHDLGYALVAPPAVPTGTMPGGTPATVITADFTFSSRYPALVQFHWQAGRYYRYQNGEPHLTAAGVELAVDNVLVLAAAHHQETLPDDDWQWNVAIIGEGPAFFYRDGRAWQGRWRKTADTAHFEFLVDEEPWRFAPGTAWVAVVRAPERIAHR